MGISDRIKTCERALIWAAVFISFIASEEVAAQTILGRVLDQANEAPVGDVIIQLIERDGTERLRALSDSDGRFVLAPPQAGEYFLATERFGYLPTRSPLIALRMGGEAPLELMISPEPLGLVGLDVSVEELAAEELDQMGLSPNQLGNRWINRADIEAIQMPGLAKDVIRWQNIAGVYIDEYDATDDAPLCVRFVRRSRQCAITVIDGIVVPPEQAYSLISENVEAIAILNPTDAATFYGTAGGGGAVLFWSRRGR